MCAELGEYFNVKDVHEPSQRIRTFAMASLAAKASDYKRNPIQRQTEK